MKRLVFPLICVFILLISGCNAPENHVTPPFFRITDEDTGGVVYLLGTMHVGRPNTVYPDEVYNALEECSLLAVEIDLERLEKNSDELNSAMRLLEIKDGTAAEYFGEEYGEIKRFFRERHIYTSALEKYIPSVWSSTLSNRIAKDCGLGSEYGTDREIVSWARSHSIRITELETVEEQYRMNANEDKELQKYSLLLSARTDYREQKAQMNELYRAWSENDSSSFEKMLAEDTVPEELRTAYDEYYQALYTERQKKMARFISETLESGKKAVVAVGAMHCYATPDILDLLEENAVVEEVKLRKKAAA